MGQQTEKATAPGGAEEGGTFWVAWVTRTTDAVGGLMRTRGGRDGESRRKVVDLDD